MTTNDQIVSLLKDLNMKLNLILGEMLKLKKDSKAVKDSVKYLYELGLDSKNIGQILGISTVHASKEITALKKKKGE